MQGNSASTNNFFMKSAEPASLSQKPVFSVSTSESIIQNFQLSGPKTSENTKTIANPELVLSGPREIKKLSDSWSSEYNKLLP